MRRNTYTVVSVLDPASDAGIQLAASVYGQMMQMAPVRSGFVFDLTALLADDGTAVLSGECRFLKSLVETFPEDSRLRAAHMSLYTARAFVHLYRTAPHLAPGFLYAVRRPRCGPDSAHCICRR
jgi:hypothetical protein